MSREYVKREILVPKNWEIPENAIIKARSIAGNWKVFDCVWEEPEPYTFPSFLPDGWWIAMDSDSEWWLYMFEPTYVDGEYWWNDQDKGVPLKPFIWTPPTVKDAASSLMQVKHVTSEKEPSKR